MVVYPTGGGTGSIRDVEGVCRKWNNWLDLFGPAANGSAVQATGCDPIVRAFIRKERFAEEHLNATTKAAGLRVPKTIGDFLILDAIRDSQGIALSVRDQEMIAAAKAVGAAEGLFVSPGGGGLLRCPQEAPAIRVDSGARIRSHIQHGRGQQVPRILRRPGISRVRRRMC